MTLQRYEDLTFYGVRKKCARGRCMLSKHQDIDRAMFYIDVRRYGVKHGTCSLHAWMGSFVGDDNKDTSLFTISI